MEATLTTSTAAMTRLLDAALETIGRNEAFRLETKRKHGETFNASAMEARTAALFGTVADMRAAIAATRTAQMAEVDADIAKTWSAIVRNRSAHPWSAGTATIDWAARELGLTVPGQTERRYRRG